MSQQLDSQMLSRLLTLIDATLENTSAFYTRFKKKQPTLTKDTPNEIEAELVVCTMHLLYQQRAIEKILSELQKIDYIKETYFRGE